MDNDNHDGVHFTRSRPFSPHNLFLSAAREAIKLVESDSTKESLSSITAITMSALAIEALCNAVGERVVKDWPDFESSSPKAKLRIICDELEIDYDSSKEPWGTIIWLSKLRNNLAHGKPQLIEVEKTADRASYEKDQWDKPESKLEQQITIVNAKRAYEKVTEIKYLLSEKIPSEKSFGIAGDMWSGRSSA